MNIDKLKEEAAFLRMLLLYILGLVMMFLAGLGTLFLKFIENKADGSIPSGAIVLLVLLKVSAIIFIKIKSNYAKKLNELKEEEN